MARDIRAAAIVRLTLRSVGFFTGCDFILYPLSLLVAESSLRMNSSYDAMRKKAT